MDENQTTEFDVAFIGDGSPTEGSPPMPTVAPFSTHPEVRTPFVSELP